MKPIKKLAILLLSFTLSASLFADEKKPNWTLSETPADILVNPTGTLSKGRPYQGTPNIVVSATGKRVFTIWYGNGTKKPTGHHENTDNYVMVSYGDENLENFERVNIVIRSPHIGRVRCFDPCGWRDPQGRVWIAWCQSTGEYDFRTRYFKNQDAQWSRRGSTWAIYTDNPDAPEPVWSAPRRLFDGNMINKPTFLKNGDALYPVCFFTMKEKQDMLSQKEGAGVWISKDKGETFKQIGNVRIPDSPYAEHMFIEKNDGTIWLLGRREPYTFYGRYSDAAKGTITYACETDGIVEAFSKDGGKSFGRTHFSKIPGIGSRTHISRLKSGNLLLMKNWANDDLWLAGKPKVVGQRIYRKTLVAYISKDDGKTWEGGYILDDRRKTTTDGDKRDIAYPDASEADNGFIYVVWDFSRHDDPQIITAKLTEADILAGKIVTKGSVASVVANQGPPSEEPLEDRR